MPCISQTRWRWRKVSYPLNLLNDRIPNLLLFLFLDDPVRPGKNNKSHGSHQYVLSCSKLKHQTFTTVKALSLIRFLKTMRDLEPRERKLSKNRIPSVLARFVRELQRFRKMTSFQIEQELAQNYFFLLVVIFKWI